VKRFNQKKKRIENIISLARQAKSTGGIPKEWIDLIRAQSLSKFLALNYTNKYTIIASIMIALSELTIPFALNLIYIDVLPSGSTQQLLMLAIFAPVILVLGAWLKQIRYKLIANNSGKKDYDNKMRIFKSILGNVKNHPKEGSNLQKSIEDIGLLKNQEYTQIQVLTSDLIISAIFLLILLKISPVLVIPILICLLLLHRNSGTNGRDIERIKEKEYGYKVNESIFIDEIALAANAIKSNGLTNKFVTSTAIVNEDRLNIKKEIGMKEERFRDHNSFISQSTYFSIVCIGSLAINVGHINMATLGTCLLIAGKVISPWQNLFMLRVSLEKNKRAKEIAGYLLDHKVNNKALKAPALRLKNRRKTVDKIEIKGKTEGCYEFETTINIGQVTYINDRKRGRLTDQLFKELSGKAELKNFMLNDGGLNSTELTEDQIIYVDPTNKLFEGSIAQNITSYESYKYFDRAVYWSVLLGLDKYIQRLPNGYDTQVGEFRDSGLDSDIELGLSLVRALAKEPSFVLINCHLQAFGRDFIDIMEKLVTYGSSEFGLVLSADSRVLKRLSSIETTIKMIGDDRQP